MSYFLRPQRLALGFVGLVLFSFSLLASASKLSVDQVHTFLDVSGLGQSIAEMPTHFRQQVQLQALLDDDKLTAERVSAAIESALANTNGLALAEQYLLEREDADRLNETIAFLRTPLGQRIVAAETAAQSPEAQIAIQAYAMQLAENMPSEARQNLIKAFAQVTDAEDTIIDMVKIMMFMTADFMQEYKPEAGELMQSGIAAEWEKIEPMLRGQMGQYVQLSSYYAYRELSDAELQQYIDFLASPAGKVYFEASVDIFQAYVNEIVRQMLAHIIASAESQQ